MQMKHVFGGMAALAVAGMFGASAAQAVDFDPTGTGTFVPGRELDTFDWAPGNSLAVGGQTAVNNFVLNEGDGGDRNVDFDLLYQARLQTYSYVGGFGETVPGGNELTIVVGIRERVIDADASPASGDPFAEFTFIDDDLHGDGTPDFLEIWFGPTNVNNLAGTGFNDGTLILSADINNVNNNKFSVTNETPVLLDQSSDGNQYGTQQTVTGNGETAGEGEVVTFDPNFFNFNTGPLVFNFTLLSNIGLQTPFLSVNPSSAFVENAGGGAPNPALGAGVNGTGSIGNVNGLLFGDGEDFQISTDSSQVFRQVIVPEPMTASLGLLGLGGLLLSTRRRRS